MATSPYMQRVTSEIDNAIEMLELAVCYPSDAPQGVTVEIAKAEISKLKSALESMA